ncbi:apoptosis-resistant E3 ubiquitin protein ligase 1-like [Octopus vulgaris]|uniref:HECT-type E3 ubiquitin transferase n=2 Tax=Octopus vulgaris TaxID=6645 RepID=A0AA36BT52_OCTVU|nr:apoptosis-resistant E3 ubiquitin protein ligase 1-like [Octopus vulgaris]
MADGYKRQFLLMVLCTSLWLEQMLVESYDGHQRDDGQQQGQYSNHYHHNHNHHNDYHHPYDGSDLSVWLEKHRLAEYTDLLSSAGVSSLDQFATFDEKKHKSFQVLSTLELGKIRRAINLLQGEKQLQEWLHTRGLLNYFSSLKALSVENLTHLNQLTDEHLRMITQHDRSQKDYLTFKKALADLRSKEKKELGSIYRYWVVFVWLMFSAIVGLAMMSLYGTVTWFQTTPNSKTRFLDFFIGKYPAPQSCRVIWDWTEPQFVGKTMTFTVKFYQKNGKPYPVSNYDNIVVEILHLGAKVTTTIDFGSEEPEKSNEARVSFTVHRSGEYLISVLVGFMHIKGSPFKKSFQPGAIDATKTKFMNYSSTVVCTVGTSHPLTIETRDMFGNLTPYKTDHQNYFKIRVRETGTNCRHNPVTQIFYDTTSKRLTMHICMEKGGSFQAVVTYGDVKLKNGEFNILVLNLNDTSRVKKNLAKRSHDIWYEARLLSCNHERLEKPKKLYVYMSPKQLTLKEYYFFLFSKKLFTFRVCPSTKFYFNGFVNQYDNEPVFTIDDGSQPPVVLAAKERNIIAATFTSFLLKNIGGSETFQDKQNFFNHEIRQLHHKRAHDRLQFTTNRHSILQSSYKVTKNFDVSDWCRNFEITFFGEEGLDWGGLRREWFEILCTELFDPNASGLFKRFAADDSQGLVHPNNKRLLTQKPKYYEFAGKIVAKCLYESSLGGTYKQLVKAKFSRSFLAQLIGLRVNYKYFETDDPELYKTKILYIEENDVSDMELTFSEEEYNEETGQLIRVVDLIPNGSKTLVTNKNKLWYLDLLAEHRLSASVKEEVDSFLRGLNELIPDNLLSIFDENELELLMCGTGNYSITDFRQHHSVCGTSPAFGKVLDWFWTIVASFTEEQMARLLQFTTGCSQLPPGGFSELNPKFQITAAPTFNTLPTAHTCFNQLCLPDYDSIDKFHKALMIAINEGNQGFGMV